MYLAGKVVDPAVVFVQDHVGGIQSFVDGQNAILDVHAQSLCQVALPPTPGKPVEFWYIISIAAEEYLR